MHLNLKLIFHSTVVTTTQCIFKTLIVLVFELLQSYFILSMNLLFMGEQAMRVVATCLDPKIYMFTINRLTCLRNNQKLMTLNLILFILHSPSLYKGTSKLTLIFISIHCQMLTQACMQSEYYEKVIDAVRFYTRTAREGRPFETLVNLMYKRPISPQFQVKQTFLSMLLSYVAF